MTKRKSLNDVLYGDRAKIRANHYHGVDKWPTFGAERCFNSHPPLRLPGTDKVIYGGSCSTPVVSDADVYVGFDSSMTHTSRGWPWTPGHEVYFKIPDMTAPKDDTDFRKLVTWVKEQVDAGKKVHVGCIGGHGRTGMFLSALVSLYGEKDAISYVRKHYCGKAVESQQQVDFLNAFYGVIPTKGHKSSSLLKSLPTAPSKGRATPNKEEPSKAAIRTFHPVPGAATVWG